MRTPRSSRSRRGAAPLAAAALAAVLVTAAALLAAAPAYAQASATGPEGQTVTVSKVTGLSAAGETVTVSGTGFDVDKGIYVAFCVDNGPGAAPSPCGGGADMSGSLGASHWISSNPPAYGAGLAVPYGSGGSFSVSLTVLAALNDDVDCTRTQCAVVTRTDHTRSADRTQDVRVPVSFAGTPGTGSGTGSGAGSGNGAGNGPGTGSGSGSGDGAGPGNGASSGGSAPGLAGVITAGPVPSAGPAPVTDALSVARVSADDSAGRWWLISTGSLLALLTGLLIVRALVRRATSKRQPASPPEAGR